MLYSILISRIWKLLIFKSSDKFYLVFFTFAFSIAKLNVIIAIKKYRMIYKNISIISIKNKITKD